MISTPIVRAVLVTTSSKVIRPSSDCTGACAGTRSRVLSVAGRLAVRILVVLRVLRV